MIGFATAGALIPLCCLALSAITDYLNPNSTSLPVPGAMLLLWPPSFFLRAEPGNAGVAVLVLLNAVLYAGAGRLLAPAWSFLSREENKTARRLLLGLISAVACVALLGPMGQRFLYEIPEGYRTWVVVTYQDPACPSLKTGGVYVVVPITPTGRAYTSDALPSRDWRYIRYEHIGPDGRRTPIQSYRNAARQIWLNSTMLFRSAHEGFPQKGFFIGTEEEVRKSGSMPYEKRKAADT